MRYFFLCLPFFLSLFHQSCTSSKGKSTELDRAKATLDSISTYYSVEGSNLLRENYPFNDNYQATYLADDSQADRPNPYSYLWPYSGRLSAVTALYESSKDPEFIEQLEKTVLPGLEEYFDTERSPAAYASYLKINPLPDRFYDDNVWIGLDFTDLYSATNNSAYLDKALLIWKFIESGTDDQLGGGIYWCEQKKGSKNTCSNAPGAVYALKLFEATGNESYLNQGIDLYEWTKKNLQDPDDKLYYDNINLNGRVDKRKYAYNSGQMIQAAALLYKITKEEKYLKDAQAIASSAFDYFFQDSQDQTGTHFAQLKRGDIWFTAIMLRGFIELYTIDQNSEYINSFRHNLNYAWENMREENGLFNSDWTGKEKDKSKWLLTQFAMVEMYARMAAVK